MAAGEMQGYEHCFCGDMQYVGPCPPDIFFVLLLERLAPAEFGFSRLEMVESRAEDEMQ